MLSQGSVPTGLWGALQGAVGTETDEQQLGEDWLQGAAWRALR